MRKLFVCIDWEKYNGTVHLDCNHVRNFLHAGTPETSDHWLDFDNLEDAEHHLNKIPMLKVLHCNYCFSWH